MNAEIRRELGEVLASHLDAMEADLQARAEPYRYAAEIREQRDSARRFAVDYEQTAYEMTRRVNLALSYLGGLVTCARDGLAVEELAEILRGDR